MTSFGVTQPPATSPGAVIRYLVGVAGLAFCLTALFLSMRAVMAIGGACASGGPYVPAVECPDVVIALTPLSIFGIFLFGGLAFWGGASLGAGWAGLIALVWPALFLSLGWNFLEFGLNPLGAEAGELAWGWLICAAVFGIMGGGPLVVGIWGLREAGRSPSEAARFTYGTQRLAATPRGGFELHVARRGFQASAAVADRLERLSRLRDAGELTDAEFEAAKRATLDEAGN